VERKGGNLPVALRKFPFQKPTVRRPVSRFAAGFADRCDARRFKLCIGFFNPAENSGNRFCQSYNVAAVIPASAAAASREHPLRTSRQIRAATARAYLDGLPTGCVFVCVRRTQTAFTRTLSHSLASLRLARLRAWASLMRSCMRIFTPQNQVIAAPNFMVGEDPFGYVAAMVLVSRGSLFTCQSHSPPDCRTNWPSRDTRTPGQVSEWAPKLIPSNAALPRFQSSHVSPHEKISQFPSHRLDLKSTRQAWAQFGRKTERR
jgi:hypothetical protein